MRARRILLKSKAYKISNLNHCFRFIPPRKCGTGSSKECKFGAFQTRNFGNVYVASLEEFHCLVFEDNAQTQNGCSANNTERTIENESKCFGTGDKKKRQSKQWLCILFE